MERKTEELISELRALVSRMLAYSHAQGILYYDAAPSPRREARRTGGRPWRS